MGSQRNGENGLQQGTWYTNMKKNLLIVFCKNIVLGKVKTRLAKTVGDTEAFNVYKELVAITERESLRLENCDVHVYFSDVIINAKWPNNPKYVQQGSDLGERMMQAFEHSFDQGYQRVIGVGSDLPDLTAEIMTEALQQLEVNDTVFGPSLDGGYYLIGMRKMIPEIFQNKAWSTETLFNETIDELASMNYSTAELQKLNDVDTIEDLEHSSIAQKFAYLLD